MWWRRELEQRRKEVEALRRRMRVDAESSSPMRSGSIGLPIKEIAALGFAAASIVGPLRAARLLLLAASALKATRMARELLGAGKRAQGPPGHGPRRWGGYASSARDNRHKN